MFRARLAAQKRQQRREAYAEFHSNRVQVRAIESKQQKHIRPDAARTKSTSAARQGPVRGRTAVFERPMLETGRIQKLRWKSVRSISPRSTSNDQLPGAAARVRDRRARGAP